MQYVTSQEVCIKIGLSKNTTCKVMLQKYNIIFFYYILTLYKN